MGGKSSKEETTTKSPKDPVMTSQNVDGDFLLLSHASVSENNIKSIAPSPLVACALYKTPKNLRHYPNGKHIRNYKSWASEQKPLGKNR